ncbi:LuxR C-terminal-related transcriptional regulator [Klebsiella aerogenes]
MRKKIKCSRELIAIDRRICLNILRQKLNYILKSIEHTSLLGKCCESTVLLSKREWQILFSLQQGLTTNVIALKLNLNLKAISASKRRAMDKLGLSRNIELHYWLIHNRLEYISVVNEP